MSEWQPIETAPKDGSTFLICCAGDGRFEGFGSYEVGRYDPYMTQEFEEVEGGLFKKVMRSSYDWSGFNNFHSATHWIPLPAPPALLASHQDREG